MAVYQSLTLTLVSQDQVKNTSLVHVVWKSQQTGQSYNNTAHTDAYYSVSMNGADPVKTSIGSYTLPYQSTKTLVDTNITVPHDNRGAGSVTVITYMNTRISAGVIELEKTMTLPNIARESTVSASNGVIGGISNISVTKNNAGFTHSIAYQFGRLSGYVTQSGGVSQSEVKFGNTSVIFTIPVAFYGQIPNARSGVCSLTVRTYSGDTQIGEAKNAAFTVSVDEIACRPSVRGTVVDTNPITKALTGSDAVLVRFYSDALCTISAEAKNGASITKKMIGGTDLSGAETERTVIGISDAVVFYAKDSREYEQRYTAPNTIIPYIKLTMKAGAERTHPTSGAADISVEGDCFTGSFGSADNSLTVLYKIDSGDYVMVENVTVANNKYSAKVSLTDMDYTKVYTITVRVEDKLSSVEKKLTLKKGIPVFDWGEDDFAFHVPVKLDTPLDIASGGTGASTADGAREALGAAPAGLTGEIVYAESKELLDEKLKQVYGSMEDYSSRFVAGNVNGFVYDIRLWRVDGNYGTVRIDSYNLSAEIKRNILGGVWQDW